jgi:hypothetical protein
MDTNPDCPPVVTGPDAGETAGRRKLWQLDSVCRGSLFGKCLAPRELRELSRKLRIVVQPPDADEVRRALVEVSGAPSPAARRLHKYLDRKYWPTILRFTGATSAAALSVLWQENGSREAADACWAVATHPHASGWLIGQVHREKDDRASGRAIPVDDWTLNCLQRAGGAFDTRRDSSGPDITMRLSAADRASGVGTPAPAEDLDAPGRSAEFQEMECLLLSLRTQVEDYAAKLTLERIRAERAEASAREWKQRALLYEQRHRRHRIAGAAVPGAPGRHGQTNVATAGRQRHVSGTG